MPKMAFEGKTYYGPAGAEATLLIENITNENYDYDHDEGNTTVRGNGSAPPVETGQVTVRKVSGGFTMVNDENDTILAALLAAAFGGQPVALRTKSHTSGKGYNGDIILKVKEGKPINGEQTYDFTWRPTRQANRAPQLFV